MDPHASSCVLSNALGILKNVVKQRRQEVKFLESQFCKKPDPKLKSKLERMNQIVNKIEAFFNDSEIRKLDLEFSNVFLEVQDALKEGSPLRSSDRIAFQIEDSNNNAASLSVQSPKTNRSPMVRFADLTSTPEDRMQSIPLFNWSPNTTSLESRSQLSSPILSDVAIVVTKTSPDENDLSCLLCTDKKFLKRVTLVDHLKNLHKISTGVHDKIFTKYIDSDVPDEGFQCEFCEEYAFMTKKLLFRHLKEKHVVQYNVFINVLTMTGFIKDFRGFFQTIDNLEPNEIKMEEIVDAPTAGPSNVDKLYNNLLVTPKGGSALKETISRKNTNSKKKSQVSNRKKPKKGLDDPSKVRRQTSVASPLESYSLEVLKSKFKSQLESQRKTQEEEDESSDEEAVGNNTFPKSSQTANDMKRKYDSLTSKSTKKKHINQVKAASKVARSQSTSDNTHDNHTITLNPLLVVPEVILNIQLTRLGPKPPAEVKNGVNSSAVSFSCSKCRSAFTSEVNRADHELRFCRFRKPKPHLKKSSMNHMSKSPMKTKQTSATSSSLKKVSTANQLPPSLDHSLPSSSSAAAALPVQISSPKSYKALSIEIPSEDSKISCNISDMTRQQKQAFIDGCRLRVPVVQIEPISRGLRDRLMKTQRFAEMDLLTYHR